MTQIININKVQTMTSLEIAEMTGKNHFDLMQKDGASMGESQRMQICIG